MYYLSRLSSFAMSRYPLIKKQQTAQLSTKGMQRAQCRKNRKSITQDIWLSYCTIDEKKVYIHINYVYCTRCPFLCACVTQVNVAQYGSFNFMLTTELAPLISLSSLDVSFLDMLSPSTPRCKRGHWQPQTSKISVEICCRCCRIVVSLGSTSCFVYSNKQHK